MIGHPAVAEFEAGEVGKHDGRIEELMWEMEVDSDANESIAEKLEEEVFGDELGIFAIFAASSSAACYALDRALKGHTLTDTNKSALATLLKHMSALEAKREELTVAEVEA